MAQAKHVAAPPEGAPEVGADDYPLLRKTCSRYLSAEGMAKVDEAYRFAAEFHRDQRRRSGEPYINHPVEVALILAHDLRMDEDVICAALLHDTVEDTPATLADLSELFGETVAELVDGVTKLTSIEVDSMDAKQALNLRKMFLAMSRDIRVVIIKLADRLHNMRTLAALPPDRRTFKAHETMDVYAPLADRLGISSIKWELEDLAFFYLEPEEYQRIARMVQDSRDQRERDTEEAIKTLTDELRRVGLDGFTITGRPKHLWSIYLKMKRKGKEFSDIYDLIALRVILQTVGDCYSALGAVHSLWHPLPGRFKDYIATPKPNGYQSLHTTVVGPEARPIEIQLRTVEMHEQAEYGIAAHWLYKRAGNSQGNMSADDKSVDRQISWIRRSLDWTVESDMEDPHEFLEDLRVDLFGDEIFVFTPKGEVMNLRAGSTPLDFAYAVHTEVGNHCVGAKVNGSVVSLTKPLATGDRVEILTNKSAKPSRDWMNIVATPSAGLGALEDPQVLRGLHEVRRRRGRPRRAWPRAAQAWLRHLHAALRQGARPRERGAVVQGDRRHARGHRQRQGHGKVRGQQGAGRARGGLPGRDARRPAARQRRGQRRARGVLRGRLQAHERASPGTRSQGRPQAPPRELRRGRQGRRRPARAPRALLQPRGRRRHRGLHHAWPRRVGAPLELPQRQGPHGAPRAHDRGRVGHLGRHAVPG